MQRTRKALRYMEGWNSPPPGTLGGGERRGVTTSQGFPEGGLPHGGWWTPPSPIGLKKGPGLRLVHQQRRFGRPQGRRHIRRVTEPIPRPPPDDRRGDNGGSDCEQDWGNKMLLAKTFKLREEISKHGSGEKMMMAFHSARSTIKNHYI